MIGFLRSQVKSLIYSLHQYMFIFGEIFIAFVLNSCYNKNFNCYNKIIFSFLSQPLYLYVRTMELCPRFLLHQKYMHGRKNSNGLSLLGLVFNIFINNLKRIESSLIKFTDATCWDGLNADMTEFKMILIKEI